MILVADHLQLHVIDVHVAEVVVRDVAAVVVETTVHRQKGDDMVVIETVDPEIEIFVHRLNEIDRANESTDVAIEVVHVIVIEIAVHAVAVAVRCSVVGVQCRNLHLRRCLHHHSILFRNMMHMDLMAIST